MPHGIDVKAAIRRADEVIAAARAHRMKADARSKARREQLGLPASGGVGREVSSALREFKSAVKERLDRHETEIKHMRRSESHTGRPDFLAARRSDIVARVRRDIDESMAFRAFLRGGLNRITPEQYNALRVDKMTEGGFLVPHEMSKEMLRNLELISPIRQIARVQETTSGLVEFPKRTSNLEAYWNSEIEERTESEPVYGKIDIWIEELACYLDVSRQLLEDSAYDLESELAINFGQAFGKKEGKAFIHGKGIKEPLGLLEAGIPQVAAGSTTTLSFDAVLDLLYDLPSAYAANATIIMNRKTIGIVRKLSDGLGKYLWQDSLINGEPSRINGVPVLETPDMPDVAADEVPIIVGDFMMGFRVLDRVQLAIVRDDLTQATRGIVRFLARRRVGGAPVMTECFRALVMKTSL